MAAHNRPAPLSTIVSSSRGCPVADDTAQRSALFHRMAGGNRITLRECKRSGAELFDWFSSLIDAGSRAHAPLPEVNAAARRAFTFTGPADHNLVISHARRIQVNHRLNKLARSQQPAGACLFLRALPQRGQLNAAQPMWLWPGRDLLACCPSEKKGLRNGVAYTVQSWDEEHAHLAGGVSLAHAQAKSWLRLAHAQTYASCQGSEFAGSLRLHCTDSPRFTRRHLFVGLSRAREASLVSAV